MSNSDFTAAHVLERWGVSPATLYPPCAFAPAVVEAPRDRILLNIGRFQARGENVPHKNQEVLVEAFRQLPDLIARGWRLFLVGALSPSEADREFHARLLELTADLPVTVLDNASHVQLTDLLGRSSIYWHAQGFATDASTHPEAQEHFGISTAEAMGSGVVPLVFATAGPLEVVSPVSADLIWMTVPELLDRTRALTSAETLDSLRQRCVARAGEFTHQAFELRVQAAWSGEPMTTNTAQVALPEAADCG